MLPGDVRRYHRIAAHRGDPYRDFAVEYPPLTLAAIELADGGTVRRTTVRLMWSQLLLDLVVAAVLAWGWDRRTALAYLVLGLAFVWYPFLYLRLDLLSVLLAVAALALVRKRSDVNGGISAGIACFAKVWPVVLAPTLLARRSWRALVAMAGTVIVGLGAWIAWSGVDGLIQVFTLRGAKGWQVESSVGAVIHVLRGGRVALRQGAARIGVVHPWATITLLLVALGIVVLVVVLADRVPLDAVSIHDGLVPLALITATLITATVLSAQYVSWLLPFAAIASARRVRLVGGLTFTIAALSTLGLNLVKELNTGGTLPMVIVLARNMLLVVLLLICVVEIARAKQSHTSLPDLPEAGRRRGRERRLAPSEPATPPDQDPHHS